MTYPLDHKGPDAELLFDRVSSVLGSNKIGDIVDCHVAAFSSELVRNQSA